MLCCWDKEPEGVGSSWLLTQSTGRPTSPTCTELLLGWIRSLCTTSAGEIFAHLQGNTTKVISNGKQARKLQALSVTDQKKTAKAVSGLCLIIKMLQLKKHTPTLFLWRLLRARSLPEPNFSGMFIKAKLHSETLPPAPEGRNVLLDGKGRRVAHKWVLVEIQRKVLASPNIGTTTT